jgi:replicative DNA helicase
VSRAAWEAIGLDKKRLGAVVGFNCDPSIEFSIEVLAVRDLAFWKGYGDLLQPEFFSNAIGSTFMKMVHAFAEVYGSPPDHQVARDLALGYSCSERDRTDLLQHVDALYTTPIKNEAFLKDKVKAMAKQRAIRAAVVKIAELNEQNGPDITDEIASVMSGALSIANVEDNPTYSTVTDHTQFINWAGQYNGPDSVPTNLTQLDNLLRGGLVPGELGMVFAPPHRGKSLVLTNFACNAMTCGRDVLYLSNEDGPRGIGPRIVSRLTGVPTDDLQRRSSDARTSLKNMLRMFNSDLKIVYRPPNKCTCTEIGHLLDTYKNNGWQPKLLVIDYADRIKPSRRRKEKWDELVDIYIELRSLAMQYGIAIWTASQTNRAGFQKEVTDLDDLAGSFGKAAEADVAAAYCQTKAEQAANEARFYLAKARNRASGAVVHLYVNRETSTLSEVPADRIGTMLCNQPKKQKGSVHGTGSGQGTGAGTPSTP